MWLLLCVYYWDPYKRREIDEQKHRTQSQKIFITNDDPSKEQKRYAAFLSRWESIAGESPISSPEDTSMPYSGIEPECHNQHTGRGDHTNHNPKQINVYDLQSYKLARPITTFQLNGSSLPIDEPQSSHVAS
ncbi:hypothetical protein TNCV_2339331 [Trichonephila clavipes]|nr:hypothetical protein TNCV_2339331 [Trichonephila clavipes]